MDDFLKSYRDALNYPKCLSGLRNYPHVVDYYTREINNRAPKLFCRPQGAKVQLLQSTADATLTTTELRNVADLEASLGWTTLQDAASPDTALDPYCRFIMVQASHSLDSLQVTRDMFLKILTFHQVMASYLDFVFSFGASTSPQDFYFGGFRDECDFEVGSGRAPLPALGRSRLRFQLCYSLRSADYRQKEDRWSFKALAVYHAIDVQNGRSNWIVTRAEAAMKDRVASALDLHKESDAEASDPVSERLMASLRMHVYFCEFVAQNWRQCIDHLEVKVQEKTESAYGPVPAPISPTAPSRRSTADAQTLGRAQSDPLAGSSHVPGPVRRLTDLVQRHYRSKRHQSGPALQTSHLDPIVSDSQSAVAPEEYTLDKLQQIEALEEKINAALLVMKTNHDTMSQLADFYRYLPDKADLPSFCGKTYQTSVSRFAGRISGLQWQLRHEQDRAQVLLRMLSDRKALIHGIIQTQNTTKMEVMTANMERMTFNMKEIAEQTQRETVSMKIITLVTLFFLPGTFISTLMSTDIIRYQRADDGTGPERKVFSAAALKLFVEICGPLMLITFVAWGVFYWWVNRKRREQEQRIFDEKLPV